MSQSENTDFFTDPKNEEEVDSLRYRFFECGIASFMDYSNWSDIKDPRFQELYDNFNMAYNNLEGYLIQKMEEASLAMERAP